MPLRISILVLGRYACICVLGPLGLALSSPRQGPGGRKPKALEGISHPNFGAYVHGAFGKVSIPKCEVLRSEEASQRGVGATSTSNLAPSDAWVNNPDHPATFK